MFVGYPANHESDSVCMWNSKTNGVVTTHDVIWMDRMFFEKPSEDEIEVQPLVHLTEAIDETVDVEMSDNESEAGESVNIDASSSRQLGDRGLVKEPDRLAYDTFAAMISEISGTAAELKYLAGMAKVDQTELSTAYVVAEGLELSAVGAGLGGGFLNTAELKVMNYKEAM